MKKGTVFNIQRFTIHDGPGIRTEVFMKGCSLRCRWCSNPESLSGKCEVGVYSDRCIGLDRCGLCAQACKKNALAFSEDKAVAIDRALCNHCMACQEACPANALKAWGREMTVEEVVQAIERDMSFYRKSGGGVTFSGGEALLQWEFVRDTLQSCKSKGIHTCVESALHVPREALEAVLPHTDLFITDIKHMDPELHKAHTGADNQRILGNIAWLAHSGKPLILRLPIIPDVNDTIEHVGMVSDFIVNELDNRVTQVQFLRFRRLGEEKYRSLGIPYQMEECNPDRGDFEAAITDLVAEMASRGIPAVAGTTQKINQA